MDACTANSMINRDGQPDAILMEMYLAGASVPRMEDITEALLGTRVSSFTVSKLNKNLHEKAETWLTRPIEGQHVYVCLDGIWLKRSWGNEVKNMAVLVATSRKQAE